MPKLSKEEVFENRKQRKAQKKRDAKNSDLKRIIKKIAIFIIIEAVFIVAFAAANSDYAEATENNTEKIVCKIDKIYDMGAGANSPYAFVANGKEYRFFHPRHSIYKSHDDIIAEPSVTLTVKIRASFFGYRDIVDIRTENTVYYDISSANEFNRSNRTYAALGIGMFWLPYTVIQGLLISFDIHAYVKKKKVHFAQE